MVEDTNMYLVEFTGIPHWGDSISVECGRRYLFHDFGAAEEFVRHRTTNGRKMGTGWETHPAHRSGSMVCRWRKRRGGVDKYEIITMTPDHINDETYEVK